MSHPISLSRLGIYLIEQIVYGRDMALPIAGVGGVSLHVVEVSIAFTTVDGTGPLPTIVVGEVPVTLDEARRQIESLSGLVHVERDQLERTPAGAIGRLILRLLL